MLSKHKYLHMKNEEGSGLILALMTLMVLSVLGASLGAITIGSFKLGDINRDDTSAYYIAEAGANMAYEELKSGVLDSYEANDSEGLFFDSSNGVKGVTDTLNGKIYSNVYFDPQFGDQPKAKITISTPSGTNPKKYTIVSTGEVAGKTRTVEKHIDVTWVGKDAGGGLPPLPINTGLIANSNIKFLNGSIEGDIYLMSSNPKSFTISNSGTVTSNKSKVYVTTNDFSNLYNDQGQNVKQGFINRTYNQSQLIPWDEILSLTNSISIPESTNYPYVPTQEVSKDGNKHKVVNNGDLLINHYAANGFTLNLLGNHRLNNVFITSNWDMNIKTNGNTINLLVDNLDIAQGNINIIDNGTVNLYVMNSLSLGGGSKINENGNTGQLNIYYSGNSKVSLSGSQFINGSLFIDKSDLELTGSGNVSGTIVSKGRNIDINGGSLNNILMIAPNAKVNFSGSGTIRGILIANEMEMNGGAKIMYSNVNSSDFPFETSGNSLQPSLDDLIITEPAIERN